MKKVDNLYRNKKDDPFLLQYESSELRNASEFLNTWLPFLCRDLCRNCSKTLSDRIRSIDPELDGGERYMNSDENKASSGENNMASGNMNDGCNHCENCDANSPGSWNDAAETNSLGSLKDGIHRGSQSDQEASASGELAFESPLAENPGPRMSWADMAQEDEFEEEEEEEEEHCKVNKQEDDIISVLKAESSVSKVVEKPKLSREQREHMRFMRVRRKKDFTCLEKIKGKIVNVLEGLELHESVFSAAEQKRIVDFVYSLDEMGQRGELKERTYSAPKKWMRGKGRITIQFGCCYNYASDKNGNPPGILKNESVDPIPQLFKVIIKRLVRWHVLPPTCVPDSCIVNIYDEGDCIPPHIDNHDFVRPFCTVSFLSECNIVFGSNLKVVGAGEFAGSIAIPLPVGSVLILNGNAADVAKHSVPAVPTKRISITFRRMDEFKRPFGFVPEPDLQGLQPLPYEDKANFLKSDGLAKKQPVRRESKMDGRELLERSDAWSQPYYSGRYQRRPTDNQRVRVYRGN